MPGKARLIFFIESTLKRRKKTYFRKPLVNERIRAREVRVVNENGEQIGIMSLDKALALARERGLDLVQITNKVTPPVCKISDYGKYLYEQKKRGKLGKPKKTVETKGIRLGFSISEHDLKTRAVQAKKFLEKGHMVRIELKLRGRQKALSTFARAKIEKFLEILQKETSIKIEKELRREPRGLTMIISKVNQ